MKRMLKVKQIKMLLQRRTKLHKDFSKLNFGMSNEQNYTSMQLSERELREVSKIFNLELVKSKSYSGDKYDEYEIVVENVILFALFDKNIREYRFPIDDYAKKYKEFYFEFEDKQKAFEEVKKYAESKSSNFEKYNDLYWVNNYKDFEKYLNRHKTKKESNENIVQKYQVYKNHWEKRSDECKYDDYYYPLTFKQWYENNY